MVEHILKNFSWMESISNRAGRTPQHSAAFLNSKVISKITSEKSFQFKFPILMFYYYCCTVVVVLAADVTTRDDDDVVDAAAIVADVALDLIVAEC